MGRKSVNTTIDDHLYKQVQILALMMNKKANDLIEEGMQMVVDKYKDNFVNMKK